jgi:hypothetical protein
VRHTPAHTGDDDAIRALLNAQAVWDQPTKRFRISHQTVNAIEAITRRRDPADYTALAQNAMADWGARTVAVGRKEASTLLSPNTLSGSKWMLTDEAGNILQSDDSSVRKAVTARVGRAVAAERLKPAAANSPLPTRINFNDLWLAASTAATTRAAGEPEGRTWFCMAMMYGIRYNAEAVARTPALGSVVLPTRAGCATPLSQCCPLCQPSAESPAGLTPTAPGPDTKAHLFHSCPHTADARRALHTALAGAARQAGVGHLHAGRAAAAILSRPDYYAGQIAARARSMLQDSLRSGASTPDDEGRCTSQLERLGRDLQARLDRYAYIRRF